MNTNAEVVSRVMNSFNSINKDNILPRRYVLNVLRKEAEFLISQKLSEGSLHREDNIYTVINCFALEPFDVVKCDIIEFRRAKRIMRSVNKLPKLISSKLGNSIKEITSLDDETEFKATTPSQYRRDSLRGKSDYVDYYVKDGYLYLLDTKVSRVNLYLITLEEENIVDCDKNCDCKSLWEYEFKCPDKLLKIAVAEAVNFISIKKNIPVDENPNLNSNEK